MSVQSAKGNSVVKAVEEACGLFGVPAYRMQSRVFSVVGTGGRTRPMFMGQWRDRFGNVHSSGMSDLLLTPFLPRINQAAVWWVECKAGKGELSTEQSLFRDEVLEAGAEYFEVRDCAEVIMEAFKDHGVQRR